MRTLGPLLCVLAVGCSTKAPKRIDAGAAEVTSTKTDAGAAAASASTGSTTPPPTSTTSTPPAQPAEGDIPAPPDVAAPPADAEKTPSGLASKVLQKGTGAEKPEPQDTVTVHYTGWTTDGKMFDSSVKRGQPATFPLKNVIPGWTEGLPLMTVGEKRRLWIPVELAYNNRPGRPAGMLVFDIELLSIKRGPKPIPAPADVGAVPADAQKSQSGLAWKVLTPGGGKVTPKEDSIVRMHYTAWSADGKMMDSSVTRGEPATFKLQSAPAGFKEGIVAMSVGEKRRFWIPKQLAMRPGGPDTPGDFLVFEIELLDVIDLAPPPDVAAPPADAAKTKSGLASKLLVKGTGKEKPTRDSTVKVHYTGWTTDGKMFDSSITRGQPAEFPLGGVIAGWTEGVQLMTVGEKRRFWIPEELAYKGQQGAPQGMLVFDVELLEIKK
jgi:FKBP-type peptidyl-prolyl cis-trans isomerase